MRKRDVCSGTCRHEVEWPPTIQYIHRYVATRHRTDRVPNGYWVHLTLCGEPCGGWTRVPDGQWDAPPKGYRRCAACEKAKR